MTLLANPTERRIVLERVSWRLYQTMLAEIGDGNVRLTFDTGRLEIMSPSPLHERVKTALARLIEVYADEMNITIEGLGSTTFRSEQLQKGLEPDECYYIAHTAQVAGKDELDLSIDPPPDLAIEVDISPEAVQRAPIYAALGVPEIWQYDGRTLLCLRRTSDGSYSPSDQSLALPQLDVASLSQLLQLALEKGQSTAVREFRARLRSSSGR